MVKALLLRIPDIARNNLVEREVGLVFRGAESLVELVGLDGELTTDSILHIEDGRIDVGSGERVHFPRVVVEEMLR